ncbi:MAG: carbohydrate ABC transporter permease [Spirochaetaceae bacterium]|nr:carbohydrate ABC transporter permease [Spirochaetaceae bacterium]
MPPVVKDTGADKAFHVANTAFLIGILLLYAYPLWFVVIASLSTPVEISQGNVWIVPRGTTIEAYRRVLTNDDILMGYRNTIFYTIAGVAVNVTMTVLAAYPLSRKRFFGRKIILIYLTFTMFFNGGLIPTYLVVNGLGLVNTFWVMIIPNAVSVFLIFIMRTFFVRTIPDELYDASAIDGSSHVHTLVRVVLPVSGPVLAVMILFYGVGHWNSYFNALIYLSDRERFTLQLILREILVQERIDEMVDIADEAYFEQAMLAEILKYAVIIFASVPVLLLYPFLQRYFVKGVMIGAIKG